MSFSFKALVFPHRKVKAFSLNQKSVSALQLGIDGKFCRVYRCYFFLGLAYPRIDLKKKKKKKTKSKKS